MITGKAALVEIIFGKINSPIKAGSVDWFLQLPHLFWYFSKITII